MARLKEPGLFRVCTPQRFGGEPIPPADFVRQVYLGSLLDTQAELYPDAPDLVPAGALFPVPQATPTERGFVVN